MTNSVSDTPAGRFPKSAHLLKHSDFLRVYQQGRRHFSGNMTFFYLPTVSEAGESARRPSRARVGFTVPKALGGAVERNRMRRRAREAVRHHLALLQQMDAAVDVVINPKKGVLTADFSELSREVERGFGVICRACVNGSQFAAGEAKRSAAADNSRRAKQGARASAPAQRNPSGSRAGKVKP